MLVLFKLYNVLQKKKLSYLPSFDMLLLPWVLSVAGFNFFQVNQIVQLSRAMSAEQFVYLPVGTIYTVKPGSYLVLHL